MAALRKFNWDKPNVEHIARHNVTPVEVEQVFANGEKFLASYLRKGETRTSVVGTTDAGRTLMVAFTTRRGRIRTITAFDAPKRFRRLV